MKRWQIVLIVMFVVIGLAGYGLLLHFMPYRLETELAEARRQGIPTSAREVRLPVIPPGQDAAPLYERAWALEKSSGFSKDEKTLLDRLVRSGVSDAEAARLRRAIDARSQYLSALRAAAAKPHLSLPSDAFAVDSPPFSQLAHRREAARTFRAEAALLLREGHPLQAVRIQSPGYEVGAQLLEQPMILSLFTGVASDAITNAGMADILKRSSPDAGVADAVMEAVGRNLDEPDLHRAMLTEVVAMGELRKLLDSAGPKSGSLLERIQANGRMAANVHWKVMLIKASEGTPSVRSAALRAVADDYAQSRGSRRASEKSDVFVPFEPKFEGFCARAAAGRRVVYTAAAVLKYRAQHGHFPAALTEALRPVPLDPIGNCPLTYRRTTRGFEVRAVQTAARVPSKGLEFEYP